MNKARNSEKNGTGAKAIATRAHVANSAYFKSQRAPKYDRNQARNTVRRTSQAGRLARAGFCISYLRK